MQAEKERIIALLMLRTTVQKKKKGKDGHLVVVDYPS